MHVITAPSNLGLRPLRLDHEPGTWRAPAALIAAGLLEALGGPPVTQLPRPVYSPEPQAGTRIRNGRTMRDLNLALATAVRDVRRHRDVDPHGRYAHAIVSLLPRLPFPAPAAAEPVA